MGKIFEENSLLGKIPGMKSVYRAFNKATNSVNSLGNRILGELCRETQY